MTTADYRVNGGQDLSTTCENEMWTPTAVITRAECVLEDLMPCNMSEIMTDKTKMEICCTFHGKARSICAKYTGVSIGSKATFTTSDHFCTETGSTKTCTEGLTWSGIAANLMEASTQEENRNEAVRSSGYVFPVSFVVSSGALLGAVGLALKAANKSRRGAVRLCFWMIVAFSVFFLGLFATLSLAFYSYTYSRTFSVRADVLRNSDSTCAAVTGSKGVRDGLLWSSFSSGTVAVFGVLSALVASRYARKRCDDDLPMIMLEPSDPEEKEPSPSTSPASPQPPLDPTEPEYNQPTKERAGAPVVYADLNRPQKEKPLPTAGGGLEYASIVTGKLQPPHKETETDRPSTGDLEYAKLSHHKMKEEQGQCVEMEGTAEKASTSPTDSSEYGKLLDQLQVKEGSSEAGVEFDIVTVEPRHIPSTQSRGEPSEEDSLL